MHLLFNRIIQSKLISKTIGLHSLELAISVYPYLEQLHMYVHEKGMYI